MTIKLVTDNGSAFKASRFASFVAATGVLEHIRIRRRSPGQNGVCERAFGSLKYEHLHRHEITDGPMIPTEAEAYRPVFNTVRPHEALGMARPAERYLQAQPERPMVLVPATQPGPKPARFMTRDILASPRRSRPSCARPRSGSGCWSRRTRSSAGAAFFARETLPK